MAHLRRVAGRLLLALGSYRRGSILRHSSADASRHSRFGGPLVTAVFSWNLVWQLASATPATPMPSLIMERIDTSPISLASTNGSPVVINLWASWCPPCRREMPMMAELAAAAEDVTFLFVNQGEGRSVIETYLTSQNLALPNVLLDPHRQVARHYSMPDLPATLFIGADGRLMSVHIGEISREALTAAIERLTDHGAE
jgi:thiol-disulfide isomerase/thioredoxin